MTAWSAESVARRLGLPRVELFEAVDSTMDEAHRLAASGAPSGTLVVADTQRAGRGRGGRRWESAPGAGLWFTLVERPNDPRSLEVLSLRSGLHVARALDRFAGAMVGLKWPNDLFLHGEKLGGILTESRWRDGHPDWVAIGVGVNLLAPAGVPGAGALGSDAQRLDVLGEVVPALRSAAAAQGHLSDQELGEFAARDVAAGRTCRAPVTGRVAGIAADGGLLVVTAAGVQHCRDGSLLLDTDAT